MAAVEAFLPRLALGKNTESVNLMTTVSSGTMREEFSAWRPPMESTRGLVEMASKVSETSTCDWRTGLTKALRSSVHATPVSDG